MNREHIEKDDFFSKFVANSKYLKFMLWMQWTGEIFSFVVWFVEVWLLLIWRCKYVLPFHLKPISYRYCFKTSSIVRFWKKNPFKLSTTPPSPSLTTIHSTLHSVHHRKTGRETISLKLNDPLKNRYEPSRRSLNRKQRLFLYPQSFAVPRRVSFFIIYMPHFLPRFYEVETVK